MPAPPQPLLERRRFQISGVVQGVGFRPFVHGLAERCGLSGFVLNDGSGVVVEAQGDASALERFTAALRAEPPPLAQVERIELRSIGAQDEDGFSIRRSELTGRTASIPPDVATCDECLGELRDPSNRRYRYPFINCTRCGPRLTIVERVPYDRASTTMRHFEMCERCRREYEDPADRRFHAEPIACFECGPRLRLIDAGSTELGDDPLAGALRLLKEGAILAIKGLGGYHLACDATSESAASRLRARKHREAKPFAVMTDQPARFSDLSEAEGELLLSAPAPIVLLRRRPVSGLAASVAPATPWLGLLAPYTPLHHLLIDGFGGPLVMTSGNRSDEPIAFEDSDARKRLAGICDGFLVHDRPIHRRCEDSVVRSGFPIRRSRGYAPAAVALPVAAKRPIVAVGAELKASFCVADGRRAFLSPHLGDLDTEAALRAFRADLELYLEMLGVRPEAVACDMHPDYLSTRWAEDQEMEPIRIQHHHAHAAACLAEHGVTEPALALVFDGTGYGLDGTLWGGELLLCFDGGFERLAHLEAVPLPGGERAIREPWRCAAAHLERAGRPVPFERWGQVRQSLGVNAPLSSGMGRLFDAVAALLGFGGEIAYEGQAAVELEVLAGDAPADPYPCGLGEGLIAGSDLVAAAHDDLAAGRPREQIAAAFHEGVARAAALACAGVDGPRTVALSGGSFQNLRLLASTRRRLANLGFEVLTHEQVPPNDGGISYGQAALAAGRL